MNNLFNMHENYIGNQTEAQNNTDTLLRFEKDFGSPIIVDSTDSEKEDLHNRNMLSYSHQPYGFNRDTCQMSPLLFESDTDDTSQSTPTKCYQQPILTPQLLKPNNQEIFNILSSLTELRNQISIQLDSSSQHNQCCSETLLNSSDHQNKVKTNTENAYISPSPRVTRSKLLNSRILTRSSKRLHKVNLLNTILRKPKTRRQVEEKGRRKSTTNNSSVKKPALDDRKDEETMIESVQKSTPRIALQRPKRPINESGEKTDDGIIQPNIVPNIELDDKFDNELDFSNRRPSSEVQILSPKATVISISSESSQKSTKLIANEFETQMQRISPDLFENCENYSGICSQNSFDIPNGQVLLSNQSKQVLSNQSTNNRHSSSNTPNFVDIFDNHSNTVIEAAKLVDQTKNKLAENVFEITVNDAFSNVIEVNSDYEMTPIHHSPGNITNKVPNLSLTNQRNALDDLIDLTKSTLSQEITPQRGHSFRGRKKNSQDGSKLNESPVSRTKWLSKRSPDNDIKDMMNRIPYRCRRLDLWFNDDIDESSSSGRKTIKKRRQSEAKRIVKTLLSSSEDEDS